MPRVSFSQTFDIKMGDNTLEEQNKELFEHRKKYRAHVHIGHQTGTRQIVYNGPSPILTPKDRTSPQIYKWIEYNITLPPPFESGHVQVECPECGEEFKISVEEWYDKKQHGVGCSLMFVAAFFGGLSILTLYTQEQKELLEILALCACAALFILGVVLQSRYSRKYKVINEERKGLPVEAFQERKLGIVGPSNNQTEDLKHAVDLEILIDKSELEYTSRNSRSF